MKKEEEKLTNYIAMRIDVDSVGLAQARKIIRYLRSRVAEQNKAVWERSQTALKFERQLNIAFNYICRQRELIEKQGFIEEEDFLKSSADALDDVYKKGLSFVPDQKTRYFKKKGKQNVR